MNPEFLVLCSLCLPLGVILWRLITCLQGITGGSFRSQDRERRDYHQMIERLLERKDVPTHQQLDLAYQHQLERRDRVRADSVVEKSAVEGKVSEVGLPTPSAAELEESMYQ